MNQSPLRLSAPAKLNLFLHITGRRSDGYHELETLFQFLDYSDELSFYWRDDQQLTMHCNITALNQPDNLIIRAAEMLRHHAQTSTGTEPRGVHIDLQKNIPFGGGLGGGSSDAATTLLALRALWELPISDAELQQIGLQLGADVPIFIAGHAAFAQGVGEQFQPAEPEQCYYLIVDPAVHISTAEIFQHPQLKRDTTSLSWPVWNWHTTTNNCEPLVRQLYPEVAKALDWLVQYAPARLTGTGACLFGRFASSTEAHDVLRLLPSPWRGFVARGINESPVCSQLRQASTVNQTNQD